MPRGASTVGVDEVGSGTSPVLAALAGGPEPLVEAKLAAPYLRSGVLPREALVERLLRQESGLATMVAPPGYGKSTTMALWRARESRPVAWVTADAADGDPMRFLRYLALAIDRALGADLAVADVAGSGATALSHIVPRLTSTLHRTERPLVLMVDDVHVLAGTPTVDVLTMLIDYLPRGTATCVAGRTDAGLPIPRYRAGGRMVEIGVRELSLSEHEAGRLAALGGLDLRTDEARDLHARTEGWPAAVYLASRRPPRGNGSAAPAAAGVSGRDTDVGDYLDAELLDHASPRVRSFLLRTSVLDRLTAPLCDAVVESGGSDRMLRDLAATNQLVVPLDSEGGWYRYHTLLREHLLARLERDRPQSAALNRRAAAWYASHGSPDLAVEHLLAAGDDDAAAAQACSAVLRLLQEGREATIERWLERLDDAVLRRQPFLLAVGGTMYAILGRTAEAERMADLMDGADYAGPRPPGAEPYEEARLAFRALLARDGFDAAIGAARRAVEASGRLSPWHPQTLVVLGAILVAAGERDAGEATLAEAATGAQAIGAARALSFAEAWRALSAIERGDWGTANALSRRSAVAAARQAYGPDAIAAVRAVIAARVAIHRGEVAEARRQMAAFQVARGSLGPGTAWASVRGLLEAATAYLALADPAGTRSCLRQAGDILLRRPDLGPLAGQVAAMRERIRRLPPGPGGTSTLTPAEIRVLRLLPTYLTAAEMAERLYVTPNTVRTQIQALYGKLGATSRAEAVEAAIEIGLLEPLPVLAPGGITSI